MIASLKLTNHETTVIEQIQKINEEFKELKVDLADGEYENAIDEAIDLAKASLKLAKTLCDEYGYSFKDAQRNNFDKNEVRGYHA